MKTKLTVLLASVILFAGCEMLKKATMIDITTDLTADIPVAVVQTPAKSAGLDASVAAISFSKTHVLDLADNNDIEPYLEKIENIDLKTLVVTVNGLGAEQAINSVSLNVEGVGNVFTQTDITMTNNSFTPVIASGVLDQVASKLTNDKKITLTVAGEVSGPMTFTVSLNFETVLTAQVL